IGALTDGPDGRPLMVWAQPTPWRLNSAVLSRHLRVGVTDSDATQSFFGGLLPEGEHLNRLARELKVGSDDLVGIFAAVGADLVGALRIGDGREPLDPQALTPADVRELLRQAPGFLVGGGGSAVPGFQRKLTLTRVDGQWMRGNGHIASTHILKPVPISLRATVDAEAYCLALTRELGLSPFEAWVEQLDDLAVLVVERYDRRRTASGTIERMHQEDFAQALGLPAHGNNKFEWHDPRANLAAIAAELDDTATIFRPGVDRDQLLRYVTATVAIGNTDAHAKNYSLLHDERGGTRLAPLYDIAPLALRYDAGEQLAMRVNGQSRQPDVTVDDLAAEAVAWGIADNHAREIIGATLHGLIEGTRTLDADASIKAHVPGYIRRQVQNLLDGAPARIRSHVPLMMLPRVDADSP
ncbi:HipA domain-containing protein, partial [Microcella sp.]|uniref:HipA domain-containing protein n=1 Tax=Microcella sp. TaxID=1913979 RepID=UPI00299F800F